MFSCFFEISQGYLRLARWKVSKGHLQNEWVIKTFRKHPKCSKFVCIKSSLQFMHKLYPFCRNSKISRISFHRFLWNFTQRKTSTQSIRSVKHFQRKCLQGQKFDLELKLLWSHVIFILIGQKIYHNKVKSMCNKCFIMFSQKRSVCLSLRDSKMEGVPTKILGRATFL